jgi:hypothetical protein
MPAPSGGDGLSAGLVSDDVYQLRVWADDNSRPGTLLHTLFDPTIIITALGLVNFERDGPTQLFSVEVSAGGFPLFGWTRYWTGTFPTTTFDHHVASIDYRGLLGDGTMFDVPRETFTIGTKDLMFQVYAKTEVPEPATLSLSLLA